MNRQNAAKLIITSLITFSIAVFSQNSVHADGTFSFSPAIMTATRSCNSSIVLRENILSSQSNAADVIITFNPAEIEILDANPSVGGIQIQPGNAYESYAGNTVDNTNGIIRLVGYSSNSVLSNNATFATIQFKSKPLATTGHFNVTFTGAAPYNTTDSNIADSATSFDMLSGVTNASITFVSGLCGNDSAAPIIAFTAPQNLNNNIAPNATVNFTVADAGAGVDITTLAVTINGKLYSSTSAGVTVTGSPVNYTVTVIPESPFPTNSVSVISVQVADFAGNAKSQSISINSGYSCPPAETKVITKYVNCATVPTPTETVAPTITQPIPITNNTPTITIIGNLSSIITSVKPTLTFQTKDESGISIESLQFTILGTTYSLQSTPGLITVTGSKEDYTITIDLSKDTNLASAKGIITGQLKITDLQGNTRIEKFTIDTGRPVESTPITNTKNVKFNVTVILATAAIGFTIPTTIYLALMLSRPKLITIYDLQTQKRIPFAHTTFISQRDGRRYHFRATLFGTIRGLLPHGNYQCIVQKYGYSPQTTSIQYDDLRKTTTSVGIRSL